MKSAKSAESAESVIGIVKAFSALYFCKDDFTDMILEVRNYEYKFT